jgi:hypothetical protein
VGLRQRELYLARRHGIAATHMHLLQLGLPRLSEELDWPGPL